MFSLLYHDVLVFCSQLFLCGQTGFFYALRKKIKGTSNNSIYAKQREIKIKDIWLAPLSSSGGGNYPKKTTTTTTLPQQATTTTAFVTTISTTSVPGGDTTSTTTTPRTSTTTTSIKGLCAAEFLLQDAHAQGLQILRNYRDKKLAQTSAGVSLISLYYHNQEELTQLLSTHPLLAVKTAQLLLALLPAIEAGTAHNQNITITAAQYRAIEDLLIELTGNASPALRQALNTEKQQAEKILREFGVSIIK